MTPYYNNLENSVNLRLNHFTTMLMSTLALILRMLCEHTHSTLSSWVKPIIIQTILCIHTGCSELA